MVESIKHIFMRKGLRLSIYSVLIPMLLQFVYIRYVSYNVDEALYGNFILYVSFVSLIAALIFSIPFAAITRYINETSNKEAFINEFLTLLWPLNVIGLLILYVYALYRDMDMEIFTYLAAYFILMSRYSMNKIIIFNLIKRKQYLYVSIFEKVARFIIPISVFYFYQSDLALIVGLSLGYAMLVGYTIVESKTFKSKFIFSYRKVKIYFFYAYPVIFTALASWIISLSDRFFIDYFMDGASVGIYSILSQVSGFASIFGSIFTVYAQAIIYKKYSEDKQIALDMYLRYIKIMLFIFIVVYIIFLLLPKVVFTVLINPSIILNSDYFFIFNILFVSAVLGVFVTISSHFFHLINKIYILTFFWGIAAIINLVGNFYIEDYGLVAASLSTLASNAIVVLFMYLWLSRYHFKKLRG